MLKSIWISLFCFAALASQQVKAQSCQETATRYAVQIEARDPTLGPIEGRLPEVYGDHDFYQQLPNGWVFALVRAPEGWAVRLFDRLETHGRIDLSRMTPPLRGVPNPRDIFGWHFRNADNSSANDGSVNAPQHDRFFEFSADDDGAAHGRGWLKIKDFGLADLEPGQRARMTYLQFQACLSWPKPDEVQHMEADAASLLYLPEEQEVFGSCGLDLTRYALSASFLPRMLEGDFDGDGSFDAIAQIKRKNDGAHALALCRAGTWLSQFGFDKAGPLAPAFIHSLEAWRVVDKDSGPFGYEGQPDWPTAAGDIVVLERIEKEMKLLYWTDAGLQVQQVYRFVEP